MQTAKIYTDKPETEWGKYCNKRQHCFTLWLGLKHAASKKTHPHVWSCLLSSAICSWQPLTEQAVSYPTREWGETAALVQKWLSCKTARRRAIHEKRWEGERKNKPAPMSRIDGSISLNKSGLLGDIAPQSLLLCCGTSDQNTKLVLLLNLTLILSIGGKHTGTEPKDMF